MPDLVTTLRLAKMEINGGTLPPMTPVPENVQHFIDPAFVPGLGALEEDPKRGLRCPVRGCGEYRHVLYRHLTYTHADIGGVKAVRQALQIPRSYGLCSSVYREKKRAESKARYDAGTSALGTRRGKPNARRANKKRRDTFWSMAWRNLRGVCDEQVRKRLWAVYDIVGRTPSADEVRKLDPHGEHLVNSCKRIYGSFDAAKAYVEMEVTPHGEGARRANRTRWGEGWTQERVLICLREWYRAHNTLPSYREAQSPTRVPLLPSMPSITKAMGTNSYPEAMRRAAALLNIYGGRYGLPEKARPKKAVAA